MSKEKELFINTLIIFIGRVSTQFLSFFLLPLYTSYLNSSDYGTIDLILTYVTLFVPVITIEIEMGTFRFLVDNRKNEKKKCNVIYNAFSLLLKISIIFIFVYALIIYFINFKYCILVGCCIFFMMFSNMLMQIARGLGKNIDYSISCTLIGCLNIAINIILIMVLHKPAYSILIATFVSNFLGSIYLFFRLKISSYLKKGIADKNVQKEILKFSWPLVPNTVSWWLINASDRTIVSIILGVSTNGIYAISTKFSAIINSFLNIFNLSWTESASLYINDNDRDSYFSKINDIILRLFSAVCICLIAFIPIIFNIFINNKYIDAYRYVPINILASFFSCVVSIYSAIYVAKKMTKQVAMTSLMSAIINIIVDLVLIKYIGLYAASISTAVAYIIMALYRSYDLRKYVKIKYNIKNLFLISLGFSISIFLYYQSVNALKIVNYIFALVYSVIMNKDILRKIIVSLKSKILQRKK